MRCSPTVDNYVRDARPSTHEAAALSRNGLEAPALTAELPARLVLRRLLVSGRDPAAGPRRTYWSCVNEKMVSVSQRSNDGLSLNCLNSSVPSQRSAVMTRPRALSCSMRALALSEFWCAFC